MARRRPARTAREGWTWGVAKDHAELDLADERFWANATPAERLDATALLAEELRLLKW